MSLDHYLNAFSRLRMNRSGGRVSPHKVCLLLAVMDLVEQEIIATNRIYLGSDLKSAFTKHFEQLRGERDQNTPYYPFYHLVTSGFWHHKPSRGKEGESQALKTPRSENQILAIIEYARVDDELFEYFRSPSARQALIAALLDNLSEEARNRILRPGNAWSWHECELIVKDYFDMLKAELSGKKFNKASHNQALQQRIHRPRGSIERKHQNISAILKEMGLPMVDGYKPLPNYQRRILPDVVGAEWVRQQALQQLARGLAETPGSPQVRQNILDRRVEPPALKARKPASGVSESAAPSYHPPKIDYVAQEKNNRRLGINGEKFVIAYEKARLQEAGKDVLANNIDHVSREDDTAGFDIHSYETNGKDRFIEVKTTNYARYTPFYVTSNELDTSRRLGERYQWYRLFNFSLDPRFFVFAGDVEQHYHLEAAVYQALLNEWDAR